MTDSEAARRVVDLISELDTLERLPRMGFVIRGVVQGESVAAHCYGVAVTAMLMADSMNEEMDTLKVMRMSLLHEVSEARITDLPYGTMAYIEPEVKSAAEGAAARDLLGPMGQAYVSLWQEFEAAQTLEARIVRAADKVQMMVKVLGYDREGRGDLSDFWANANYNEHDWGIDIARELFREIRRRHEAQLRGRGPQCCE
jgi:putative hydrolase of HD superfamily